MNIIIILLTLCGVPNSILVTEQVAEQPTHIYLYIDTDQTRINLYKKYGSEDATISTIPLDNALKGMCT